VPVLRLVHSSQHFPVVIVGVTVDSPFQCSVLTGDCGDKSYATPHPCGHLVAHAIVLPGDSKDMQARRSVPEHQLIAEEHRLSAASARISMRITSEIFV
jgi:hypothetical protein